MKFTHFLFAGAPYRVAFPMPATSSPVVGNLMSVVLCAVFLSVPAEALQIRTYNPTRHDRINGFPSNPSGNAGFLYAGYDLTGVGWSTNDTRKQFTLVSPRHFVGARHFLPPLGSTVRFLSATGSTHEFTVAAILPIKNAANEDTDIFIGVLGEEVGASLGIRPLTVLNLANEAAYNGRDLLVTGNPARAGRGVITGFQDFGGNPLTSGGGMNNTRAYNFVYNTFFGNMDDAYAEVGDSGSPSFVIDENGNRWLVGTHTAVLSALGTITTIDSFLPAYFDKSDALMEALGFHLKRANTTATTHSLGATLSAPALAAGGTFSLNLAVANTGAAVAHNLDLTVTLAAGIAHVASSGAGWAVTISGNILRCRRGGSTNAQSHPLALTLSAPIIPTADATFQSSLTWDGAAAPVTANVSAPVFTAYARWSQGLSDPSASGDPDNDNVDNAIEYATGGDGANPSIQSASPSGSALVLSRPGSQAELIFTRRKRGATVTLQRSTDLAAAGWGTVGGQATITPGPGYEFETVSVVLTESTRAFFRLAITLD